MATRPPFTMSRTLAMFSIPVVVFAVRAVALSVVAAEQGHTGDDERSERGAHVETRVVDRNLLHSMPGNPLRHHR